MGTPQERAGGGRSCRQGLPAAGAGLRRSKLLSALLVAVALIGVLSEPAAPAAARPRGPASPQLQWILQAVLPDGAIAVNPERSFVSPYLANFAAMGLARGATVADDPAATTAAWNWLFWYQRHQDRQGFVTDYRLDGGRLVSTGAMDSSDAYAGTFLLAVREAWLATGDVNRLLLLRPAIERAVAAILATQDVDGLTWAKPGTRVKYLMDQAETYAGLRAAGDLAGVLCDAGLAQRSGDAAMRIQRGIGALWNDETDSYDWAVHGDGSRAKTDWNRLYPDALQQVWPVAFGLVGGPRAAQLVARFAQAQASWDAPTAPAVVDGKRDVTGYRVPVAIALEAVGRVDEARRGAMAIEAGADAAARRWPFTVADAGQLVLAEDPRPGGSPFVDPGAGVSAARSQTCAGPLGVVGVVAWVAVANDGDRGIIRLPGA